MVSAEVLYRLSRLPQIQGKNPSAEKMPFGDLKRSHQDGIKQHMIEHESGDVRRHPVELRGSIEMKDLEGKKLPTIEQVEIMIKEWGTCTTEDFSERFELESEVVEATIECLRRLRRVDNRRAVPAIVCYRDDNLESIVRCAGSKHGYI